MDKTRLRKVQERIADADYRLTPQRELILRLLFEHSNQHPSAEDIYDMVRKTNPEVGLATIYRTLELLLELKVVQGMEFGDGRMRYELVDGQKHAHHHLICLDCGRVSEVDEDLLDRLEHQIEATHRFHIVDHQVKFYGRCRECELRLEKRPVRESEEE